MYIVILSDLIKKEQDKLAKEESQKAKAEEREAAKKAKAEAVFENIDLPSGIFGDGLIVRE